MDGTGSPPPPGAVTIAVAGMARSCRGRAAAGRSPTCAT